MKLYESAYTYIPFVYLFVMSFVFGFLFHHQGIFRHYRPFTVLSFLLVNTFVQFYFKTDRLVKHVIHKHVWKTITLSIYGILCNSIHEMIFEKFHFDQSHLNFGVSTVYIILVLVCGYYFRRNSWIVYVHIFFLYFPIARLWEINLYLYVVYVSVCTFIMFSKCSEDSLMNNDLYTNPVIKFFIYLRINDAFVLLGLVQLYFEYYSMYIPELKALDEIESIIEEQTKKLEENFDDGL